MRVELRIGRLVADDLGGLSKDDFVAAVTRELRGVLARELAGPRPAGRTRSVPRVLATVTLPAAGGARGARGASGAGAAPAAGATGTPAGRAVGAALGVAVTSERVFPRSRRGRR